MTRYRAVSFDGAGTLFAPREPIGTTYARIAARHGIVLDATVVGARFTHVFASAPPLAFGPLPALERASRERAWWQAIVASVLGSTAAGAPAFDACFDELFAHYATGAAWRLFPDVRDTLDRLRTRGFPLALVSNFDGRLPAIVDDLGLAPRLDAILFSTAVGAAKPAYTIFEAAARALDCAPAELLHVGDDVEADVRGALAAGLGAVLIDRTGQSATPSGACAVKTLADVAELLR